MAPKKKKGKASELEMEKESEKEAEREEQLHREYENLTETLRNFKSRAAYLRRENKALHNLVNQIRIESQEYVSYMLKQTQKYQNVSVSVSDQKQQKLEEVSKERQEMVEKHEELVNGLKKEILEKETELAQLKLELAELGDLKRLQQQQLDHIFELEEEEAAARCHQVDTLHSLKANSLKEEEEHKAASKRMVWECFLSAKKEAPLQMRSYIQEVTKQNCRLYEELCRLIMRAQALRKHQELLQAHHKQLLLEKVFVQELQSLCNIKQCQHRSCCYQTTDPEMLDNKPCFN